MPSISSTDSPRPSGRISLRIVHRAQQHLLAAAAAGQQADADFHQSDVEFGVRLARRGVQEISHAAAQRQAEGRRHHRLRART